MRYKRLRALRKETLRYRQQSARPGGERGPESAVLGTSRLRRTLHPDGAWLLTLCGSALVRHVHHMGFGRVPGVVVAGFSVGVESVNE